MFRVDLNSDLGESFGSFVVGMDEQLIPLVTSANIACGCHAGDPVIMQRSVARCKAAGTALGAHPGFADLQGFGRRAIALSPGETKALIQYQIGALWAMARAQGMRLSHVKTHGAMYNLAAKDPALAAALAEAIAEVDPSLILLGLAGSPMLEAGRAAGLRCASEVFADRGYRADGTLVPRGQPGDMVHDPQQAIQRVVKMVKQGTVTSVDGREIEIQADSICVHGDNPQALEFVGQIRARLQEEGVCLCPLEEIV